MPKTGVDILPFLESPKYLASSFLMRFRDRVSPVDHRHLSPTVLPFCDPQGKEQPNFCQENMNMVFVLSVLAILV